MKTRYFFSLLLLFSVIARATDYQPGFVWNRYLDWTPGTVPGSSLGNADDDLAGSPVWFYGNVQGGGDLGDKDPWYTEKPTAQVWDNTWTGAIANQAWARAYNGPGAPKIGANPPITRGNLIHDLSQNTGSYNYRPAIQWLNPVGGVVFVNIAGTLTATWNGFGLLTYPDIPVEVAFARFNASTTTFDLLYSAAVSNPMAGESYSTEGLAEFNKPAELTAA